MLAAQEFNQDKPVKIEHIKIKNNGSHPHRYIQGADRNGLSDWSKGNDVIVSTRKGYKKHGELHF